MFVTAHSFFSILVLITIIHIILTKAAPSIIHSNEEVEKKSMPINSKLGGSLGSVKPACCSGITLISPSPTIQCVNSGSSCRHGRCCQGLSCLNGICRRCGRLGALCGRNIDPCCSGTICHYTRGDGRSVFSLGQCQNFLYDNWILWNVDKVTRFQHSSIPTFSAGKMYAHNQGSSRT